MPTLMVVDVVVERYKTNAAIIIIDAVQSIKNSDMVRLILRVSFRPESLMTASSSVVLGRLLEVDAVARGEVEILAACAKIAQQSVVVPLAIACREVNLHGFVIARM